MFVHEGHTNLVNSVAFSPDGQSVVSGSDDYTVRIWDARSSYPIGKPLRGHSSVIFSVAYSPLGNLIASGSDDNTIRLWDPRTGQQSGEALEGHHKFYSVTFSPNARLIASGSDGFYSSPTGNAVQLWNAQTNGAASVPLTSHTDVVQSVSFSPDGARLVSGSKDKTIRVWDVERGETILGPLEGHSDAVRSISHSPDGAQIGSGSSDGTIRLWDPRTGRIINNPYTGHTDWVRSVSFSPRGTYLVSGSDDGTVRLWDVRTSRQVGQPFEGHTGAATSVVFSPCGQFVASGSLDRRVIVRKVLDEDQYPNSGKDVGPQIVTSRMSTQQIFECLCRAGCTDLSSQMDTRQESAMIASGGGFGDIWKGEMHSGEKVAIKAWRTTALELCEYKTLKRAARELHLWSRMGHPHIHRLQGVILFRDQYLGMVSEWMNNGNLHDYLLKHPGANRFELCIHVASGLEYMHSCSIVHGDLKAVNVLVSSEGIARISDFDFSIMSEASSLIFTTTSQNRAGSVRWVAPEMLTGETPERTIRSDVYALGMTVLEIFTGEVPYSDRRIDGAVILAVMMGTLPTRPFDHIEDNEQGNRVWNLLSDCWSRDPDKRPSAGQVLQLLESAAGITESTTPPGSPPLPKIYPIETHMNMPSLLAALLPHISFRDWNALNALNAGVRRRLEETDALREEVLEYWLRGVGYARWKSHKREQLTLTLHHLNAYMRGVSIARHRYSAIAESFLAVRAQQEQTRERVPGAASKRNLVRALASSCRAYTKVVLRLREQADFMTGDDFKSPLFKSGNAPLLRVFVPSKEGAWLSDANVLDREKELKRAGALGVLRVGDVVWDTAVGDEGNAGRMVWDGNYLVDLDYTYSTTGELPKYIHSLAFSPSYWHKTIRKSNSPLCHIDLTPYAAEIAANLHLVQDRVQTETPQGGRHTVVRWVHRSRFQIRTGQPIPGASPPALVDRMWEGYMVVEVEGTNEGLADLQTRVGNAVRLFPTKTAGMELGPPTGKSPFRLLRSASRPGEIRIRAVREKERLI